MCKDSECPAQPAHGLALTATKASARSVPALGAVCQHFSADRSVTGRRFCAVLLALALWLPLGAQAEEGWNAPLLAPAKQETFFMVDKQGRRFHVIEHNSPARIVESYACISGQKAGDKQSSGDLRTPEGVYFVTGKIGYGLDFAEYGGVAYALNYPNPVDKINGKTGHGIWIHSKGQPIVNQATKGCVALDLGDIDKVGARLKPGTAVALTNTVMTDASLSPADQQDASVLETRTRQWAQAWADRSPEFFDFYHPSLYSKAQEEDFAQFRRQKESLFKMLPWIHNVLADVQVLKGPDYWVSWFRQYYRASNLTSQGVRRLYWQKDAQGQFQIVGMEWLEQDQGMEGDYLEWVGAQVLPIVEEWRKAWLAADIKTYRALYTQNAVQGNRSGAAIFQQKEALWRSIKPVKVELTGLRIKVLPNGVAVDMTQIYNDSAGKGDKGEKVLLLQPVDNTWRIASETWTAIP